METFLEAVRLLFGADNELRQIIWVTLQLSLTSTLIASVIGISLGLFLGTGRSALRKCLLRITHTLMGLPPVVAGLVVFMLLSRKGPFGSWQLLFSMPAMVIAQVILITPIVSGLTASAVSAKAEQLFETTRGLGLPHWKERLLLLFELRRQLVSVLLMGFGRAISEVGAVQLVGGNIQHKTRVMTTAIMLETNKGNFELAVALGGVLLLIALCVSIFAQHFGED
ncbi:MAG: ABC transporter permease [Oscillospiraceae bacterium]